MTDDALGGTVPRAESDTTDDAGARSTNSMPAPNRTPAGRHQPSLAPPLPQPGSGAATSPLVPVAARQRRGMVEWLRAGLASYRLRIVGWFVILLALTTLATVLVVGYLLLQRIDDGIREQLVTEIEEFRSLTGGNDPLTGQPFGTDVRRMFEVFMERSIPASDEVFLTFLDGQPHLRSPTPVRYPLEQDATFLGLTAAVTEVTSGRMPSPVGAVDYLAVPVRADSVPRGVMAVAVFRDVALARQQDILLGAVVVGMILLVIGSLLAWRLADRLLAPVLHTAETARAISETDLSKRVDVAGNDEVAELGRTLNEMLDRLQSAFADQRRFLDEVGHELRTPLTIVRGHLELLDEGTPDERARTRDLVLDELDRMTRLVSDLMVLAQSHRPDFVSREWVDAGELAARVHEKASVLGPRVWRLDVSSSGWVSADPQRITQAMLQLVSNAVAQTADGAEIRVGAEVDAHEVRWFVRDSGPGIPVEEQARIFERFYRSREAPRGGGSGLGLSIVQAIAEAHGGRVELASLPGLGARFTIAVPLSPTGQST